LARLRIGWLTNPQNTLGNLRKPLSGLYPDSPRASIAQAAHGSQKPAPL